VSLNLQCLHLLEKNVNVESFQSAYVDELSFCDKGPLNLFVCSSERTVCACVHAIVAQIDRCKNDDSISIDLVLNLVRTQDISKYYLDVQSSIE
jgi:hypothetical protein